MVKNIEYRTYSVKTARLYKISFGFYNYIVTAR